MTSGRRADDGVRDGVATDASLARHALKLLAVDPSGLGGAILSARAGPGRDAWLGAFQVVLGKRSPVRRVPLSISDDRIHGGLDLAATLASGRPVVSAGLLAEADGGAIVLASAERMSTRIASSVAAAIDSRRSNGLPALFATIALDEGSDDDARHHDDDARRVPDAIAERLAFRLDQDALDAIAILSDGDAFDDAASSAAIDPGEVRAVAAARKRLAKVVVGDDIVTGLTEAAAALGITSIRAALLAVRAARAAAALDGRMSATTDDARIAAALVLGHRATRLPPSEATDELAPESPPPDRQTEPPSDERQDDSCDAKASPEDVPPGEIMIEAAKAAIPAGLLAALQGASSRMANRQGASARSGAVRSSLRHGRPAGSRPGDPRRGGRLDLVATLRRAAPWQAIRKRERAQIDPRGASSDAPPRVEVRRDDLVVRRYEEKTGTVLIFAVDASGSAALARLAEAKGAVELLLADCYARRDEVAVIAFRGLQPDLLLPPTRALARAKRALRDLPGGGATPLAAALDAARELSTAARRKGMQPAIVMLTDGRANVARDGRTGRAVGETDALAAAALIRLAATPALIIDTSDRPQPQAAALAAALGARFLALPGADARRLSGAVRAGLPGA